MRKYRTPAVSFFIVTLVVSSAFASSRSKAAVTPAVSAEAQLAQASRLWTEMERTPPPQKFDLVAQVLGNLALVRKQWPNNKEAVARSGILQADLTEELGMLPQAVDGLLEALPAANKTDMEPAIELRLGKAYEQMGNATEAEKHFQSAETALHGAHLNRLESSDILNNVGLFYARQNKPSDAIRRFHEAQKLPGQDVVRRTSLQLSVIKEAVKLDKGVSDQELAQFDDLIAEAQRTNLSQSDAVAISDMQQHSKRIRDKSKP